jgi:hypothetical protein
MKEIIINDRHFIVEDYTEPKVFYNENADDKIGFSDIIIKALPLEVNELPKEGTIIIVTPERKDILTYSSFEKCRNDEYDYSFTISKWNFIR